MAKVPTKNPPNFSPRSAPELVTSMHGMPYKTASTVAVKALKCKPSAQRAWQQIVISNSSSITYTRNSLSGYRYTAKINIVKDINPGDVTRCGITRIYNYGI